MPPQIPALAQLASPPPVAAPRRASPRLRQPQAAVTDSTLDDSILDAASESADAAPPAADESGEIVGTDMELIFLGTGSCLPTVQRSVACSVLRLDSAFWMFDAGEGSQVQLQRSTVRPGSIDRIFVTHLHGDHAYGLPGVLCLIGNARHQNAPPVEIYGPAGLRLFLRTTLALSRARAIPRYRVHELHDVPFLHERFAREPQPVRVVCAPHAPFEQLGDDIRPERVRTPDGGQALRWRLFEDRAVEVSAGPLQHSVPCVGYVVTEADRPGRLRVEHVLPRLMANAPALKAAGVRDPMVLMKRIKALAEGEAYALPDGSQVTHAQALEPPQPGRKVVVLGDTCDALPMAHLAAGADVVVHEATNTYMQEFDGPDEASFARATFAHGHSTAGVAGEFAARVGARALVLSHFSQRHLPIGKSMRRVEKMARKTAGESCVVVAAHDLSRTFVSRSKDGAAIQLIPSESFELACAPSMRTRAAEPDAAANVPMVRSDRTAGLPGPALSG